MHLMIHRVERIELSSVYPENGNSKTLRIVHKGGELELTVYGDTDALDALPRSEDFREFKAAE